MQLNNSSMQLHLKLEELAMFLATIGLFYYTSSFTWWHLLLCILLPDLGMLGYLINTTIGAYCYNFLHSKVLALVVLMAGFYLQINWVEFAGIILFAHSSMDRILGYGLKYTDSFKHTHLGNL